MAKKASTGVKRAPSEYNLFVREHMKGKTGTPKAKMTEVAAEWRKQKSGGRRKK